LEEVGIKVARWRIIMGKYNYVTLMDRLELKERAAEWFHDKWHHPTEAYLACIEDYISGKTKNGWYLYLDGNKIALWFMR